MLINFPTKVLSTSKSGRNVTLLFIFIEFNDISSKNHSGKFKLIIKEHKNVFPFYTGQKEEFIQAAKGCEYEHDIEPVTKMCDHYLMMLALDKIKVSNVQLPAFFKDYKLRMETLDQNKDDDDDAEDNAKQAKYDEEAVVGDDVILIDPEVSPQNSQSTAKKSNSFWEVI